MNIFQKAYIANDYDTYYQTPFGKKVDQIEKKIISGFLQYIPKKPMLDVGCGTGHWTQFFIEQGFDKITGIDASEEMLNIAKSKNIDANFLLSDAENLPFKDESYPVIAFITMLEFVENQDNVIKEMYRLLVPGGWLILGCLNAESALGKNKANSETFKDAKFLTIPEIKSKFEQFEIIQIETGVHVDTDFTILDETNKNTSAEPLFIGVLLKKNSDDCNHRD